MNNSFLSSHSEVDVAKSKGRILVTTLAMAATFVACGYMIYQGRQVKDEGVSLEARNIERHRNWSQGKE